MREGQNGRASTSRQAEAKTAPKTNVCEGWSNAARYQRGGRERQSSKHVLVLRWIMLSRL